MVGTHTASDYIFMETSGAQFSGSGTLNMSFWFIFRNGTKTILPGTEVEFVGGYGLYVWTGSATITNEGSLKMNWLGGIDTFTWLNDAGSILDINRWFYGIFTVSASTTNKEVIHSEDDQTLVDPVNSQFYNLTLTSNSIDNTKF
ncbi:MAG: nitrate reductase NapE component [Patiriisocius sp.]|jgi:nitrate reductase NapE component